MSPFPGTRIGCRFFIYCPRAAEPCAAPGFFDMLNYSAGARERSSAIPIRLCLLSPIVQAEHRQIIELRGVLYKVCHCTVHGLHDLLRRFVFRGPEGVHHPVGAEQLVRGIGGLGHAVGVKEELRPGVELQLVLLILTRQRM